jgi:hypothetical protein
MKKSIIICLLFFSSSAIGQVNIHTFHSQYTFNPAITGNDSSTRLYSSYSNYECYGEYNYLDINASTHIRESRYGLISCLRIFDYYSRSKFYRPVSLMVAINSTYRLSYNGTTFYLKPALEAGITCEYLVGEYGSGSNPVYKVNEHDERFRYSGSFVIFNNKLCFGANYFGFNRPDYKGVKPTPWLGADRKFAISCSYLLGFIGVKKEFNDQALSVLLFSADRFPIGFSMQDHYASFRRAGISYAKPKFQASAFLGILNDNLRFKEYKLDLQYRLWYFDLGLKIIYCDEPKNGTEYIIHSVIQPFPLTNMTMINYSLTYHFNKKRSHYTNWANMLVF